MITQMVEMMRLPKELRQICRNRIDEKANLTIAILAFQERAVIAKGRQPQGAQAPCEPGVGHVPLVRGKNDAASLIDYSDNRAEIRSGEGKLLTGRRVLAYVFHTQRNLLLKHSVVGGRGGINVRD